MAATSELQQLRDLLIAPEVTSLQILQRDLTTLQRLIQDPEQFSRHIEPILGEMLRRGDPEVSLAILKAVTPFLDRAVKEKMDQDLPAMTGALAPASTGAIAVHYAETPEAAAQDMAPLVSAAIKEQIRGERDAMIDALYPVIGSTISKYLAETLNTIVQRMNARIEATISLRSIARKVKARLTGVSEGELILRDAVGCRVDAAFLIHKNSGLVIAQSQNPDVPPLDPDLLSGMLTAIRSLFNESMAPGDRPRELDQITYGESRIILEVAGFFYLAAVVRGIPTESFRTKLRETLSTIVQIPGDALAQFTGDQARVPHRVTAAVQELVQGSYSAADTSRPRRPWAVIAAALAILLIIGIPLGISLSRNANDREVESRTRAALLAADSVAFRSVMVGVNRDHLTLTGEVSNAYQRARAAHIAEALVPEATVTSAITTMPPPALQVLLSRQIESTAAAVNSIEGVFVETRESGGNLVVSGLAPDSSVADAIQRTFGMLPGLNAFRCTVTPETYELSTRVHFTLNSTAIRPAVRTELERVTAVAKRVPWASLRVIGHSDLTGEESVNKRIALGRALSVRDALIRSGIAAGRMSMVGNPEPPPDSQRGNADSLSRCVRFILVSSGVSGHQ